ncbi:MAG: type II secretion system protein [Candidatus Firestonebacteria bacterium]
MNRINNNRGFTLIEVAVTFAIVSVIILLVYKTFSTGLTVYERVRKETEALQGARSVLKMLTKDIRSIAGSTPVNEKLQKISGSTERSCCKLVGDETSLDMITNSRPVTNYWPEYFPRRSSRSGVTYYQAATNDENMPVCYFRKVKWDFAASPWANEEIERLDGIIEIKISYFNGADKEWKNSWSTEDPGGQTIKNPRGLLPHSILFSVTSQSMGLHPQTVKLETQVGLVAYER